MSVHALILAGGRGSRLGDVRKAHLRIGNRQLLDRVIEQLEGVEPPLLIATGPGKAIPDGRGIALGDGNATFEGPMAGILAAIRHLEGQAAAHDILVTVAVDTPFLPRDFVARLVAALDGGADAAHAVWGQNLYPPNAAYRLAALTPLLTGPVPNSPKRLLERLGAVPIDWMERKADDPFANLNTIADLIALGRRARSRGE